MHDALPALEFTPKANEGPTCNGKTATGVEGMYVLGGLDVVIQNVVVRK